MARPEEKQYEPPTPPSVEDGLDLLLRAVAHAPPRSPPPESIPPGTLWGAQGRYVIGEMLGRGGMGTVYAATDSLLSRPIAVKVLDPGCGSQGPADRRRLLREARVAARIEHERIARVYDVGEHEGALFVAMELVRGVTLRAWMTGRSRQASEVAPIVRQIAEGLAALHARGVFHRDLKPENVMLAEGGGVRLLDFGLARHDAHVASVEVSEPLAGRGDGESIGGAFSGTPGYMAPEQCLGKPLDARVDVFAFGVLLYELVTGSRPFGGERPSEIFDATVRCACSFECNAWVRFPASFLDVTRRALARDPADRFVDGAALLERLTESPSAPPPHAALLSEAASQELGEARTRRVPHSPLTRRRLLRLLGLPVIVATLGGGVLLRPVVQKVWHHQRQLLSPPPSGMALIDEGPFTVGESKEAADRECADLGALCNPKVMAYRSPAIVTSVEPFYLDAHEVTNAEMVTVLNQLRSSLYVAADEDTQQRRFVRFNKGAGPFEGVFLDLAPTRGGIEYTADETYRTRPGREAWPVNQVSWSGARLYCATVGKRLPTEREWEAAARGRTDRRFPWGSGSARCGEVALPSDGFAPVAGSCPKLATPVPVESAAMDATPQGIRDLGGNVSEWVDSAFVAESHAADHPPFESPLPRVLRGGAFSLSAMARTSARNIRPPNYFAADVGFRCARDIDIASATFRKE